VSICAYQECVTLDYEHGRAEEAFHLTEMPATKYRHTLIYRIEGVHLGAQEEAEIIADPATGFRAILSTDPGPYCFEADRYTAIANTMLNAFFRQPGPASFDERLTSELKEIRESRKREFGRGPYLVLIKEDEVEQFTPPHTHETEDFVIWLNGAPKEPLRQASETQILAALAALMVAAEDVSGFDKVSDAIIFLRRDGKPIYSYTARLTGNPSILRTIPAEAIESVSDWYRTITRHQELERVHRLLVSSLQTERDTLRAFLDAWAAMEILINKTFKTYEGRFFRELDEGAHLDAQRQYLGHIRTVMKDKYRLVDKFAVVAPQLDPENADEDVRHFTRAKQTRDKISHGQDINEASLPVRTVQELARRYLRLHLAG